MLRAWLPSVLALHAALSLLRAPKAGNVHQSVTSPYSSKSIGLSATDGQRGGPQPPNAAVAGRTPFYVRYKTPPSVQAPQSEARPSSPSQAHNMDDHERPRLAMQGPMA